MSTFSNTAREVEMPNGDIVKLHDAVTPNSTSNIKKFKYDDNGHVTESEAANATDLNLNSYATPTSGTTAIGTSDNVQTAIGKLDHQSHIDQTNILYTLGRTGKNLYDIKHPTRAVNITLTDDGNGQFTQSASGAWAAWDYDFDVTVGVQYTVYIKFKSVTTYNAAGAVVLKDADGNDIKRDAVNSAQTLTYSFTAPTSRIRLGVTCNNSSYNQTGTFVMQDPMIVEKSIYDNFPDYQPYSGRQNSDLTYLEAEDRAALAEEIDAGAKNKVNIADVTTTGSSFVLDHVAISLLAGSYTFSYTSNQSISGDIELILRNGTTVLADHTTTSKSGRIEIPFTLASAANNITLYSVRAGTYSDFMICTKAAFGVSPKFVPYQWEITDITNTYTGSSTWNYFDKDNTTCKLYRNPQTHCCIATINTITKAEFPINTSVAIGSNQILTTYRPKATAAAFNFFGNSHLVLSKNSINEALALTAVTSPVPSGTAIEFQVEWHYV